MLLSLSRRAGELTKEANIARAVRAVGSFGDDVARAAHPTPNLSSIRRAASHQPLPNAMPRAPFPQQSPQELSMKADSLLAELNQGSAGKGRFFERPPIMDDLPAAPMGGPSKTSFDRPPAMSRAPVNSRVEPGPASVSPQQMDWKRPAMIGGAAGVGLGVGANMKKEAGVTGGALKLLGKLTMGGPKRMKATGTALLAGGFGAHAAGQGALAQHMDVPNVVSGAPSPHTQVWDAAKRF